MSNSNSGQGPTWRQSIGTKLTIIFLVLAIVPMAGTAYYNLTQGQGEVVNVAEENLLVLSYSVATEIEQLLTENQRTSATLAGEPLIVQYMASSPEERQALQSEIDQTLQNFAVTHPDYDAPGLIDTNGDVLASTNENLVGRNYKFRDYFDITIVQGNPYISDISVGRSTGSPGVFLTNPAITEAGEIVGMNIIRLKGESIWRITDNLLVGEEGITYLVDQDGVIIAHPNGELLYRSLGQLTTEAADTISSTIRFGVIPDTQTPRVPESLGIDNLAAELIAAQGSGSYRYYSPLDQRNHVVGYTRLDTQPWIVAVDLPEAQFLAPLQRLRTIAWISGGLVAALALLISVLLARGITRPISHLTRAAIAVENDQPFEPSDIVDVTSGRDEIAHLGRVFGDMVVALRRRMSELRTVYEIGQDITATLEVDETLQAILDRVKDVIDYDAAEITLLDRQENALVVTAWSGSEDIADTRDKSYQLGEGFVGTVGQERTSMLVANITDRKSVGLAADGSMHSLLGIPLLIRDRLVGTLELVSRRAGAFDANDQRLLETIAPQAAIAIEKAQQVREREQKLKNQIEQLRIEIDQAKRERQVSAITDTDYFQDLSRRASEMRKRAKGE
ncbi:MAG: GAF domain-containing protein [Chloroflexi bacterium]|nr:GAF domain-containing protein [Chloroflexota bacterium]